MAEWDAEKTEMVRIDEIQDPNAEHHKSAYLIILKGPKAGKNLKIEKEELTLGRSMDADVLLDNEGVSRRHARILKEGDTYWLEDLGSTNGVFVNGEKLDRTKLFDGDRIQIGTNVLFKFTFQDELEEQYQRQLYEQATKDALTGIHNKKYFVDHLKKEFAYAFRHHEPLSLILFDIDFFKKVNDTYGHLAGDYVLKELAGTVKEALRQEDLFARYGGEEFAVVLKNTDKNHALLIAERLRAMIESQSFHFDGNDMDVTISLGASTLFERNFATPVLLVQEADNFLYEAKTGGRNRVMPRHHNN
tara:strand:+ start:2984 stop:3895 length:912 start_codon:yes stop_codon:yes gene_type:complete